MENRYVTARRNELQRILTAKAAPEDKLDALSAFGERETRSAFIRGYRRGLPMKPSAVKAGKIRPVESGQEPDSVSDRLVREDVDIDHAEEA